MVQTEDQYVFIHEALLEAVMAGYTEIPCRSLHHHIQQLMQTEPGKIILTVFRLCLCRGSLYRYHLSVIVCHLSRFVTNKIV